MSLDPFSTTMKQGVRASKNVGFFPLQSVDETDLLSDDESALLQYQCKHPESAMAAAAFATFIRTPNSPKLIVFDKDGTLGDSTGTFRRWALHMTDRIQQQILEDLSSDESKAILDEFHQHIGWDTARNDVVPSGPIAAGTWLEILTLVYQFLEKHASKCKDAVSLALVQKWHLELGDLHGQDRPLIEDLRGMIETCKRLGYLVGVCTSDDRAATDSALKNWGVDNIIDVSICGDEVTQSKPNAEPLQALCQRANKYLQQKHGVAAPQVLPRHCIMVGDTSSDTGTARAAKAGFCVGVLTGSATADHLLDTGAHLILPHVGHIPAFLETLQGLASDNAESQ